MDERLKKALEVANLMVTYNTQRDLLKEEFNEKCLYHEQGHRFTVSKDLINFLSTLISMDHKEDIVVLDDFENPYMISDVVGFRDKIFSIYIEASNSYYQKFFELKSKRSVEKIMEL